MPDVQLQVQVNKYSPSESERKMATTCKLSTSRGRPLNHMHIGDESKDGVVVLGISG